ncbi:hypothetical protein IVA80_15265 [Bradyrhizobium sp. 139]|uniref:hypothetical protein n=1 Tax=Bradyrhizobium sp. 139 TaxID=2782616 RepID=UPI001FF882C5|nr:hypothetical protein [Bradyrhizobium sp. 139]MCK1742183.1 hypothetical protein [Bradyrhizobium sp. 139]
MPPLPKSDPNVTIPPAVRRLAEQAEAAFKVAHGGEDPAPQPVADPAPQPVADPAPQLVADPVTPTGNPAPVPSNDNWEHRYNSMKGRYDRAMGDIRALSDQVTNLQGVVANMQSAAPSAPAELHAASLLTPEEVTEYGQEFLSVVGKRAKEELSPEFVTIKNKLDQLERVVQGTTQVTHAQARRNLEVTLDSQIPNWREINTASEFHEWLALPDLFSGAIRQSLLTAAYEQNDTPRVVAFFKGFLAHEVAAAPAPEPALADATSGKIPLETFAAPGKAKTAAASSAPAEKPTFTHAQVSTFYTDVNRGKYRGRDQEKDRIERQIVDAGREGRIR